MDNTAASQIKRILNHEMGLALRGVEKEISAIYAQNSAQGRLQSGATIKQSSRAISDKYCSMVPTVADKVRLISQEPEAWDLVRTSFAAALPSLEETIRDVARTASGRSVDGITPSILQATLKLFETFKADLLADLEIKGFEFTKPATTICPPVSVVAAPSPPPLKNKGGKPLAAHWDEMWACIAVQLWSGNLKPKSQADVKSAMFAWFNKSEIDVGETAVTERARQLWLKIVATQ